MTGMTAHKEYIRAKVRGEKSALGNNVNSFVLSGAFIQANRISLNRDMKANAAVNHQKKM